MNQARYNYLSRIARDICKQPISLPQPDIRLPCITWANFLYLFEDIKCQNEMGAYRDLERDREMLELLNSLHDFDSLRKLVTKLRDYPVFENPLTSEEEEILGDSERIMSPIKIFLEQATQPQSAMSTQPLSTLLERRELSEVEVAEAQADLLRSERQR